jgi:phosphatidylserine/phosphatidylglycerophosphate/cardiolipin synthase-like enzyme
MKILNLSAKTGKIFLAICLLYCLSFAFVALRKPPAGTSTAFPWHQGEATFLQDEPGQNGHKEIIPATLTLISTAEKYIIADFFLFNSHRGVDKSDYPQLSRQITNALIKRKQEDPTMPIILITDPINNFYGSYQTEEIKNLREHGIKIIETNLRKIRDPNPLWAAIWRPLFSHLGKGGGWLTNPIAPNAPKVSIRSYLELFNLKANHRKTIVTEKGCIISSANPHDASYPNSNSGIFLQGETADDLALSELIVANFSGGLTGEEFRDLQELIAHTEATSNIESRLLTENAIKSAALETINSCEDGDKLDLAMFYLSDEKIITALAQAALRGADIRIILDRNIAAFGRKKGTIPNRVTAARLMKLSQGNIDIRWAKDQYGEQFHHKTMLRRQSNKLELLLGSANYTRRNLSDFNLETNLQIAGTVNDDFAIDATLWFDKQWTDNSTPWSANDKPGFLLTFFSRFQEFTGLCSF